MDDEDDGTAPIMRWWRRDSSESSARAMVDGWLDGLLVGARSRKNIKMNSPLGERENLREKRIVRIGMHGEMSRPEREKVGSLAMNCDGGWCMVDTK